LRWLLLCVGVLAALFAWIAPFFQRELAWHQAVDPIRRVGGSVAWYADTDRSPETAASISLIGTAITDEELALVSEFHNAATLLLRNTQITDSGLRHLTSLRSLQYLDLKGTRVTDSGVEKLQRALPDTKISH